MYIERAKLMEYPIRLDHYDKGHGNEHFVLGIESVLEYAKDLPAADVAPVVRCRDCQHWHKGTGWCDKHSHFDQGDWEMFYEDDFCSCGERRSGGNAAESV